MRGIPTIREPLSQKDVIYFILTDRFRDGNLHHHSSPRDKEDPRRYHGGNFAGIKEKIPYLVHLGITALWITPVYLNIGAYWDSDSYHGYWTLDFERIDPHLTSGAPWDGKEALRDLVEELHRHGIKVILDMVVNHTGYHTPKYLQYPYRLPDSWFYSREKLAALPPEKKYLEEVLAGLPHLDHSQVDVRDYFVNNIVDWIEDAGFDGIRMDTVRHVEKEFWYYFKSYVRGKYRQVFFLGEDMEDHPDFVAVYQREHDFDSLFDFPLRKNIIEVLIANESWKPPENHRGMMALAGPRVEGNEQVIGVLDADDKYNNPNRLVTLLDNHDLDKRIMSWALDFSGQDPYLAVELVKYVLTFQFTTRGIPQIYYGTEVGLEGEKGPKGDYDLRRDMPWEMIDEQTREPRLQYPGAREIYRHLKMLIKLRQENESIPFGYLFTLYSDHDFYAYMREFRGNTLVVVLNNRREREEKEVILPIGVNSNVPSRIKTNLERRQRLEEILTSGEEVLYQGGEIKIKIGGKKAKVYRLQD